MDLNDAQWRKASRSSAQGDQCVEVAAISGTAGIRDSKDPHGPKLVLSPEAVRSLVNGIKSL
ncbi:DUF397 domain-containing protein [Actinomadura hibisca]|uniref:DUF397 domain-containing protein n=1 Tax=Actinomadura hibisca TaxID=68565 RepID=UPI000A02E1AF|nr:DUF397 domain-containing protein [Actinomadura hibisca]